MSFPIKDNTPQQEMPKTTTGIQIRFFIFSL